MNAREALHFVAGEGIVLESANGPVPSLLEHALGRRVKGSWWGHPQGKAFFWLTRQVRDSDDVLVCRLVSDKITYVHRRLWPALAYLEKEIGARRLRAVREVHTSSGAHRTITTPFRDRIGAQVRAAAAKLGKQRAQDALSQWQSVLWPVNR